MLLVSVWLVGSLSKSKAKTKFKVYFEIVLLVFARVEVITFLSA